RDGVAAMGGATAGAQQPAVELFTLRCRPGLDDLPFELARESGRHARQRICSAKGTAVSTRSRPSSGRRLFAYGCSGPARLSKGPGAALRARAMAARMLDSSLSESPPRPSISSTLSEPPSISTLALSS